MAITREQLLELYTKAHAKAQSISANTDHRNWYPCGNAYLQVKGTSPLVKAIKANPDCGFRAMKGNVGYWVSINIPEHDAFECQSLNYKMPVYEALSDLAKEYGIDNSVGSYID